MIFNIISFLVVIIHEIIYNYNREREVALNDAILELYPHANLSVNKQEGLAIAIVNSMGQDADTVVFDYLWKIICN